MKQVPYTEPLKKVIDGEVFIRDSFGCYTPESFLTPKIRICKPEDALPAVSRIRNSQQEIFMVLCLNACHELITAIEVTKGLANKSQTHPRETFREAISVNAVSIMVAHNHPSGNLEASVDDLFCTRRLAEAGRIVGIPLIDHLIVCSTGFISLRERFPDYFTNTSLKLAA